MHDALRMDVGKSVADVVVPARDHLLIDRIGQRVRQRLRLAVGSADEVHREIRPSRVVRPQIGHLDDARMRQLCQQAPLDQEPFAYRLILLGITIDLQGATATEAKVLRFPNLAHSAIPEFTDNIVFGDLHFVAQLYQKFKCK